MAAGPAAERRARLVAPAPGRRPADAWAAAGPPASAACPPRGRLVATDLSGIPPPGAARAGPDAGHDSLHDPARRVRGVGRPLEWQPRRGRRYTGRQPPASGTGPTDRFL